MSSFMKVEEVAAICHEANRVLCQLQGDNSQPAWNDVPDWQRNSIISGVKYHINNPLSTPESSHENWLKEKIADGWTYGEVKDIHNKVHPNIRPYEELSAEQQAKDHLFRGIVNSLISFIYIQ